MGEKMDKKIGAIDRKGDSKKAHLFSKMRQTRSSHPLNSLNGHILHLQQTMGNQAVQDLFQSGAIQAKLTIGQPNDILEQEADRIAQQVMQMSGPNPSPVKGTLPLVQRKPQWCPE